MGCSTFPTFIRLQARLVACAALAAGAIVACAHPPPEPAEIGVAVRSRAAALGAVRVRHLTDFSPERLAAIALACGYAVESVLPEPQGGVFGAGSWKLSGPGIVEVSLFDLAKFAGASVVSAKRIVAVQASHGESSILTGFLRQEGPDMIHSIWLSLKASGFCACPAEVTWDSRAYRQLSIDTPDGPRQDATLAFVNIVEFKDTPGVSIHVEDQRVVVVDRTQDGAASPDCIRAIAP
jgi:hypothetical protein